MHSRCALKVKYGAVVGRVLYALTSSLHPQTVPIYLRCHFRISEYTHYREQVLHTTLLSVVDLNLANLSMQIDRWTEKLEQKVVSNY